MANKKKIKPIKNFQSIVSKNLDLSKIKIDPTRVIDSAKNKIGKLYTKFKKDREKNKIKLEKKEN